MALPLLRIDIKFEHDVVLARQRARQTAQLLGFDAQDQARIGTAVSELARNVFQYAGSGKVELLIEPQGEPGFHIRISDAGKGIDDVERILAGDYVSKTGMGLGIIGARRLMDGFDITSTPGKGTTILIVKHFLSKMPPWTERRIADVAQALASHNTQDPFAEIQRQNQELLLTLDELNTQRASLAQLNQELEETNRGVVALYAELDERADYLKRASELKTQFLSNMTHEFRTPLNSILSISQMLLARMDGDLSAEQEKQVKFIQRGARNLTELVNDLLDLAKVEAGKVSVHAAPFSVTEMFGTLRGMLKPLLGDTTHVALVFDKPEAGLNLTTDEGKLSQILRNFISNGLKFTEKGEVRVRVQRGAPGEIIFSVTDTGVGIGRDDQWRIFEEFTQIEGSHQKIKGTGLGLPLSKKLAEILGGYVLVESAPGVGSVFSVTLPQVYAGPAVALMREEKNLPAVQYPHCTALIIDDEAADRYVLKHLLNDFSLEIVEASSGTEGLILAGECCPDIIFIDLSMPGMSGFEAIEKLRQDERCKHIPIVVNSSKVLTQAERDSLNTQAAAILSKNHSGREMSQRKIHELLKRIGPKCVQKDIAHGK